MMRLSSCNSRFVFLYCWFCWQHLILFGNGAFSKTTGNNNNIGVNMSTPLSTTKNKRTCDPSPTTFAGKRYKEHKQFYCDLKMSNGNDNDDVFSSNKDVGKLEELKQREAELSEMLADIRREKLSVIRSRPLTIGIIGFGRFGQFIGKTFAKYGRVVATSRSDYSELANLMGIKYVPLSDLESFFDEGLDVIVVATSIMSFDQTIRDLVPYIKKDLLKRNGGLPPPANGHNVHNANSHYASSAHDPPDSMRHYEEQYRSMQQQDGAGATDKSKIVNVNKRSAPGTVHGPLIVDVLSVKEHARQTMIDLLPPECDILCTHPMFGPDSGKDGWHNLNFVYEKTRIDTVLLDPHTPSKDVDEAEAFIDCKGGLHSIHENSDAHVEGMDRMERFLSIWEEEGCHMVQMSCKDHDAYAANSQFITHLMGRILGSQGLSNTPIDTKGFESVLKLIEGTTADSFDLFYGLYKYNQNSADTIKNLRLAMDEVERNLKVMEDKDKEKEKLRHQQNANVQTDGGEEKQKDNSQTIAA